MEQKGDEKHQERVQRALDSIGAHVSELADQAKQDRVWIEDKWIEDIRQLEALDNEYANPHNITKPKTNSVSARISDLLFQNGDKNFSITPDSDTPVPQQELAVKNATELEKIITNQLDESDYESEGRKCADYAVTLGVGVIQGPIHGIDYQRSWQQGTLASGEVINVLKQVEKRVPKVECVSTWDYFPDLSVAHHKDCRYEFIRRYKSKIDLQLLLKREDFHQEAILDIINNQPVSDLPRYLTELRDDNLPITTNESYEMWEGYAPIPTDMLKEMCSCGGKEIGNNLSEEDLTENFETEVYVYFSEKGKVLKIAPHPLETEERPFSVFCYDRDESCFLASKGIPRLLRTTQRDINHSWTRINDNSDLSVGPQYIADESIVEPIPVEGEGQTWEMTGNKGWRLKKPGADPSKAFYFFNVPSGVQENMVILDKALSFADTETNLPRLSQGDVPQDQARMAHQTFSLLYNAANSVPRAVIKDWDDNITVPLIRRMIDYVMQHHPKQGLSGNFTPNAQGTSSLLLKETQAQNAMNLAKVAASNPEFAARTKWDELYKRVVRGLQYSPDAVMYTEEELEQKRQENPPQPSPEQIEAQANLIEAQNEKLKLANDQQKTKLKYITDMKELALKEKVAKAEANVKMLELKLEEEKMNSSNKEKVVSKVIDGKVKAATEKTKAAGRIEEIKMQTKGKESLQASEFLLEGQRQGAQINRT